jgi:hypothetical protein
MVARLPTTLGDRNLPTPQRGVHSYEAGQVAKAQINAGQEMARSADKMEKRAEREAILDAAKRENDAKRSVMDMLYGKDGKPGLYDAKGADALNMEKNFRDNMALLRQTALKDVGSPLAQQALEKGLTDLETANLDNIKRYTMQERRSYATDLLDARGNLAKERVGIEYNNEKTFATSLKEAEETAVAANRMSGYLPEDAAWKENMRKARSGIYATRLDTMFNNADPAVQAEALTLFEAALQSSRVKRSSSVQRRLSTC